MGSVEHELTLYWPEIAGNGELPMSLLGMANLYVGDGYRAADAQSDLSNLCLLVRTWGRVTSVDAERLASP